MKIIEKKMYQNDKKSLFLFYDFLFQNGLTELFEKSKEFSFLLYNKDCIEYASFDELIDEILKNIKPIEINFRKLRKSINSNPSDDMLDYVALFSDCFGENQYLFEFFYQMLIMNGIIKSGRDFHDRVSMISLRDYINSEDFDGVSNNVSSPVYVIHLEEMRSTALMICDMSNLPSKFFGDYLVCQSKNKRYYIQLVNYF